MTTYSQRYSSSDSNTAGAFVFHADASGNDVPVSKIVFGAAGVDPTVVTASVGLPITILAGTAAIGKLTANSGVTIGAVEIAAAQSIAATQSGTWTVGVSGTVAVSAASLPLPSGASTAANQSTIIASLSSIDGHVDGVEGALTSIDAKITAVNTGAVVIASSALPTGAATAARQDTGNTSLTSIDAKVPALGQALAAASVPVVLTAAQLSTLTPLTTLPTVTTVGTVTTITNVVHVDDNSGSLTVDAPVGTPVFVRLSDGAAAISTLPVSLASVPSHAVTNAGTFAVQESGTPTIVGNVAHDGADSGNPVKVGAKATTSLSGLTLVADADRTNLFAGVDGVQVIRPHCNLEDIVSGNASNTDGTSTACISAQSTGIKTYLTTIILTNTSSSNIYVEIKDGTTVKLTIPVPANGGAICNLPVPIGGTSATAWNFDPSAATSTVYCSMIGFKSKV